MQIYRNSKFKNIFVECITLSLLLSIRLEPHFKSCIKMQKQPPKWLFFKGSSIEIFSNNLIRMRQLAAINYFSFILLNNPDTLQVLLRLFSFSQSKQ